MIRRLARAYIQGWARAFDYRGRSARTEYYTFMLVNLVLEIGYIAGAFTYGAMADDPSRPAILGLAVGWFTIYLATGITGIAVAVRRLHDTGRGGWWVCVVLIPILGRLALWWFMRQPTKPA